MGTPQEQLLRTPLELLMKGQRVGHGGRSAEPAVERARRATRPRARRQPAGQCRSRDRRCVANLFIARDDARNYIVLGDPAVRLRTEAMA